MSANLPVLNRSVRPDCPAAGPVRVVQFGSGVFLRGFLDWFLEKMRSQGLFDGSAAVVQPTSRGKAAGLRKQDGLYTLLLRGVADQAIRQEQTIISIISELVDPYEDFAAFLHLAELPSLQAVVSNTTETGISWLPGCQLADRPAISFPAKLTQFLYHRFCFFAGNPDRGLLVLPCELVEQNGSLLLGFVRRHAGEWQLPAAFMEWLAGSCRFCNTLVDRIVTGYPQSEISQLEQLAGYRDDYFITAEPYHLWVIEGQPVSWLPFAQAGLNVIWTDNLDHYRERKVRILNGAHTMTFAAALLSGLDTVAGALQDPDLGRLLRNGLDREILPSLPMSRPEAEAYAASVLERFANPFIEHFWRSIALNALAKFKVRVLPSLLAYCHDFQAVPPRLSFSLAALLLYYRGSARHQPEDELPVLEVFQAAWNRCGALPAGEGAAALSRLALAQVGWWGQDLNDVPGLADAVAGHLADQLSLGMRKAVQKLESRS